jgi:ATP-dependent Lon protease
MKKKTYKLPLIPLRDMVGFPNVIFPFLIGRHKSILALKAIKNNNLIFLSTQKSGSIENPSSKDIEPIGVIARIIKKKSEFDNTTKVLVSGIRFEKREPYFLVEVEEYKYQGTITKNIFATAKEIVKTFENLIQLSGNNPIEEDILEKIRVENDPIQIAFTIAFQLPIPYKRKQKLLLIQTTKNFLNELFLIINNEYEIAKLQSKIRGNVKKKLDSIQKKIILTQQMESIKKELNELEGWTSEIDELKETVKKSGMPKETMEKAIKEVKKLDYTPNFSPEYTVILNYLNWLTSLPWKNSDEERKELRIAKNILEKDHWGLKKIKERIVEILAVRQLSKLKKGPVICFVGPPGVGKTSLGKSIARAMNRKFGFFDG